MKVKPSPLAYILSLLIAIVIAFISFSFIPKTPLQIPVPIGNSNNLYSKLARISVPLNMISGLLIGSFSYGAVLRLIQLNFDVDFSYLKNLTPFYDFFQTPKAKFYCPIAIYIIAVTICFFAYKPELFFENLECFTLGLFGKSLCLVLYIVMILLFAVALMTLGGFALIIVFLLPAWITMILGNILGLIILVMGGLLYDFFVDHFTHSRK